MISDNRKRDWSLGLFFLCCVVVLWVLSSFLLNNLFEQGTYSKPFLITWFNTASFSFYLIPYFLKHKKENLLIPLPNTTSNNKAPLTFNETMKLSLSFCILWFLSNFFNNSSLIFTSVSSQTILSSTSSFFTMLIGYLFSQEEFTLKKIYSLIGLFIGVILVTLNDNPTKSYADDTPPSFNLVLIGDILALLGALCYGVYSILLKLKVNDDSRIDMKLFFGFVGIFNILLLWPFLILVNYLGYETFELPSSTQIWSLLLFNCLISFLADFLWARAMLLTSPLTVTVGLCLTIPLALICDLVFKFKVNSPTYFFGAFLVCLSFYWINKAEHLDHLERTQQ